ncbi:MAG: carbohydrate kinase [Planctomycetes bacterium]|nr:carbohydrate kinase [Planctomycetota bacterium]
MTAIRAIPVEVLRRLAARLHASAPRVAQLRLVAGFDGFVDEMISVVGTRTGRDAWTRMESMAELARVMSAASGRNSLREIVVRSQDPGGCAVNLGDGLAALGVGVDFFGTIGSPRHPAFDAFAGACRSSTALGRSYGRTLAFEFGDGKFMFSAVEQLAELDPPLFERCLADGSFTRACAQAGLLAFTNWTLYPHMTACWRLLHERVLSSLTHHPWLFLDLVDPSSRSDADVRDMLAVVRGFEGPCRTVLGVNLTEAAVLGRIVGLGAPRPESLAEHASALRTTLGISQVVIHNAKVNAVAEAAGSVACGAGPFCERPAKTTGAGDRFNAGYCLGLLLDLEPESRLALASATSGSFIRAAHSATLADTARFVEDWANGTL